MKTKIRRIIHTSCLVIVAVCAVIVTVKICSIDTSAPSTTVVSEEKESASVQEAEKTPAQKAFDSEEYFPINTPYGDLYFPKDYQSHLETQVTDENGVYTVSFSYKTEQGVWEMYSVCFGDKNFGLPFGTVGDGASFTISFADDSNDASWTEEDILRVSTMREAINDILKSVEFFDGYQK